MQKWVDEAAIPYVTEKVDSDFGKGFTEVNDRDQFQIDMSRAKHKPPKIRKNLFLLFQTILDDSSFS